MRELKNSILGILLNDPRAIPLNVLMHKVFKDLKAKHSLVYIKQQDCIKAIEELMGQCLVGKNQYNKYFIDYLDYPETDVEGEGFIEIDAITGNAYITIKKRFNEYKKSSHFVHKKNLNGANHGDYVRFVELMVTNKKHFDKFSLIDAKVRSVIEAPNSQEG